MRIQLKNFMQGMRKHREDVHAVNTWLDAFIALEDYLDSLPEGRKIVFIDEMPWMDTPRSNFISGLEHFWNSWASWRDDIKLIKGEGLAQNIDRLLFAEDGELHDEFFSLYNSLYKNASNHIKIVTSLATKGKGYDRSAQIDMLIDRADRTINLCEMKFHNKPYAMTRNDEENIERKVDSFKEAAKTDKSIIVTMITTMGLERNEHSEGIQKVITLDQLFC